MSKLKNKIKNTWLWLRKTVINKEMLLSFIIAEFIFWSPCIITGILAVTISDWWWTAFTAIIIFWAGPFTPALPLQIALAVLIKKIINIIYNRRKKNAKEHT